MTVTCKGCAYYLHSVMIHRLANEQCQKNCIDIQRYSRAIAQARPKHFNSNNKKKLVYNSGRKNVCKQGPKMQLRDLDRPWARRGATRLRKNM